MKWLRFAGILLIKKDYLCNIQIFDIFDALIEYH